MPLDWTSRAVGISNRMYSVMERNERILIMEDWKERSRKRIPGTHTLGKEFASDRPQQRGQADNDNHRVRRGKAAR